MTITNKLKTIAKAQINHIIQRIPVSDLRSILAPRGVLIFENERESHLHTLSLLHGALHRDFFDDDVTRWREDFGHRGEAIRYLSNTNSSRSWSFDVYSAASVTLLRDLYIPGEEPPPVQLPELDDAVQAWNAQHGTEFVIIDESELSELQDQAATLESDIESITNDATEADGEVRDLKKELASYKELLGHALDRQDQLINENVDLMKRCGALAERTEQLNEWIELVSGYGLFNVSEVEEKLDTLMEWEDLIGQGLSPSEIEEKFEEANDWIELGNDTGMEPCEIQQELDRLEEVDADLEEVKNQLGSAKSKALEIGLIWRSLEIALDC